MALKLSILIATMPERNQQMQALASEIVRQINPPINGSGQVEIIIDPEMSYNIGTKRNKLLSRASGDYVVYIDDDDLISPDYISKILTAIESNPDCIGISGTITTNGQNEKQWHISKEYGRWYGSHESYYRTPNHISPVRRELALAAGFPEIEHGEDYEYSMRLLPMLHTEIKIEGNIYKYQFQTK